MSQAYTPPPPVNGAAPVPNNLVLAIVASALSLFCCCLPHGVISLIFALQVQKKADAGDLQGAMNAAKQAKMWAWISIIVSAVGLVIAFFFGVLGGIMSSISR